MIWSEPRSVRLILPNEVFLMAQEFLFPILSKSSGGIGIRVKKYAARRPRSARECTKARPFLYRANICGMDGHTI